MSRRQTLLEAYPWAPIIGAIVLCSIVGVLRYFGVTD
jgi:hypothetical protein